MIEYTLTFNKDDERLFKSIRARLDDTLCTIVKDLELIAGTDKLTTVMTMDPEDAIMFRFGMKFVKIDRTLSEAEKAEKDKKKEEQKAAIFEQLKELLGDSVNDVIITDRENE